MLKKSCTFLAPPVITQSSTHLFQDNELPRISKLPRTKPPWNTIQRKTARPPARSATTPIHPAAEPVRHPRSASRHRGHRRRWRQHLENSRLTMKGTRKKFHSKFRGSQVKIFPRAFLQVGILMTHLAQKPLAGENMRPGSYIPSKTMSWPFPPSARPRRQKAQLILISLVPSALNLVN